MITPVDAATTTPGGGQNRLCRKLRSAAELTIGSAWGLPRLVFLGPGLRILLLGLLLVPCMEVPADGAEEFVRQSIRARGMGNAFTAIVNRFIANEDGTSKLEGPSYFLFFVGLMTVAAVLFVFFATSFKERRFIQEEGETASAA